MVERLSTVDLAFRKQLVSKRAKWLAQAKLLRSLGRKADAGVSQSMANDVSRQIRAFDRYESQTRKIARSEIRKLKKLL